MRPTRANCRFQDSNVALSMGISRLLSIVIAVPTYREHSSKLSIQTNVTNPDATCGVNRISGSGEY